MRLWHYKLLRYLPNKLFDLQLRELNAIMKEYRDTGDLKDPLVKRVCEFPREELFYYFLWYQYEYCHRYRRALYGTYVRDFKLFGGEEITVPPDTVYEGWHDNGYLLVCVLNLFEQYKYARGDTQLTKEEWLRIKNGWETIVADEKEERKFAKLAKANIETYC